MTKFYFPIRFIFLLILFLFAATNNAQNKVIDSINLVLKNPKLHDTTRLLTIAKTLDQTDSNSNLAMRLNEMMGEIAAKNLKKEQSEELNKKYTKYLAAYYSNLGNVFDFQRNASKAITNIDKSISLFKSVKAYDEMYYTIIYKGIIYSHINENQKAIANLFTSLKYFEKNQKENQDGISLANSMLATIYAKQEYHQKAIFHFKKSIEHLLANKTLSFDYEYLKSEAYINCGSSYLALKKYSEANNYFNKALSFFKKNNLDTFTSICLSKLAQVKIEEAKYQEAETLLHEALKGDIEEVAVTNTYVKFGDLYFRKKDFTKAETYLSKAFTKSKEINNIELQEKSAELLFQVSKQNKNYKKALDVFEFQVKLNDSSKFEASKNELAQQQLKYDYEKKELKLKLDAEKKTAIKNNWLIGLSGALLLLLFGGYFYYRNNKQKQAITMLEKEQIKQKLLVSQMNPHFIFNSIDNIQGLIYENNNDEAVNYLTKFSKLTRQILENSNENYISLEEEIAMTQNYISIQQLLYNNKFSYSIIVEDNIEQEAVFLPPMLTQPFIENAIKHGLRNTTENGKITVRFYLKNEKLLFEVTDNGKGFETNSQSANHKSMAMNITKERLISYTKNQDFVVHTANVKDTNEKIVGAKVSFEIPYIYEK